MALLGVAGVVVLGIFLWLLGRRLAQAILAAYWLCEADSEEPLACEYPAPEAAKKATA